MYRVILFYIIFFNVYPFLILFTSTFFFLVIFYMDLILYDVRCHMILPFMIVR